MLKQVEDLNNRTDRIRIEGCTYWVENIHRLPDGYHVEVYSLASSSSVAFTFQPHDLVEVVH